MDISGALLLQILREQFQAACDETRALGMQAYMKSEMPYWGVPMPKTKDICKKVFVSLDLRDSLIWQKNVMWLWTHATHREERYAAIELASHKKAKPFHRMEALPMYETMIRSGAWWDLVDAIVHRLGVILRNEPVPMKKAMLRWSQSENIWIRRASILCQLDAKTETDPQLLYQCIEPSLASKEFFLRKAIGWALRQYARFSPSEVHTYVLANRDRMSGLSYREATKHLAKLP